MKNNVVVNISTPNAKVLADLNPGTVFRLAQDDYNFVYIIGTEEIIICLNNGQTIVDACMDQIVYPVADCKIYISL
jgi:hypothetical protein